MYKYADDCTVSKVVITKEMDSSTIQQEIDNVNQWSTVNNMKHKRDSTKETASFFKLVCLFTYCIWSRVHSVTVLDSRT